MTDFDYKAQFDRVMLLVRIATDSDLDVDEFERQHSRAESMAPFLDPTRFINGGADNLRWQREALDIALPFIRKCRKFVDSVKESRA